MAADFKADVVLPAKSRLAASGVYLCSLAFGLWTAGLVGWWLYLWSGGETGKLVMAVILWPLVWLLFFVIAVQAIFGLTALLTKALPLKKVAGSTVVTVLTLFLFSRIAIELLKQRDLVGLALGGIWFMGLGVALFFRAGGLLGPQKRKTGNG